MKLFSHMDIHAAYEYSAAGGQALHVWNPGGGWPGAPSCFARNTKQWGHLMDRDIERLERTARSLGVRVIKSSRIGQRGQHIDLCGAPLQRAVLLCTQGSLLDLAADAGAVMARRSQTEGERACSE